ncbi:nuclear matrix protein NMP200 [Cylindrobasidium torrendii FP15055 ss-10]|uniref:Pre-mRNA-processing factor 19 n=1 Tax=Cylindrobasidium torrendii FP15055 ss-10 TaxID=1314674 RepID=A0A0D7B5X1_9AGAR|nr:nuclear matrix protein NMP200 [Cylindrobasidium torrendii FP15055 ss-10]
MFFCAISGEPPQEPVVSAKSRKVYERRLIVKYINENGTDPVTGDKLEESDLIAIDASPSTAPPRAPTHTSVPALLTSMQNEWDALMLEMFALKQQYNNTRQELSVALYREDAATRVVARLIRERDASREALAKVSVSMGGAVAAGAEDVQMADATEGLPAEVSAAILETQSSLSASRKKRKPPTGYAGPAQLKTYTAKHTIPSLHSASPAGITALAVSRQSPSQFLTGGNDKIVQLYDRSTDKVLASLKGHSKKINHVTFREQEGENTMLLSASADKIAKVWSHDPDSQEYIPKTTVRTHKGELTGLAVHPTNTLFMLGSTDKTYSIHDFDTFEQVFRSLPGDDPFTSLSIHPDGALVGLGTPNSSIQIYDIRAGAIAASLTPPDAVPFTVNTLAFSENGYHLLAPCSSGALGIWDLRKQKVSAQIAFEDGFKINKVLADHSGQFFGVAGSGGGRVYAHKTWEELIRLEEGGDMSDIAFGQLGQDIWGATGREVRIWGGSQE